MEGGGLGRGTFSCEHTSPHSGAQRPLDTRSLLVILSSEHTAPSPFGGSGVRTVFLPHPPDLFLAPDQTARGLVLSARRLNCRRPVPHCALDPRGDRFAMS